MGIPLALARDYFLIKMQTRQTSSGAACLIRLATVQYNMLMYLMPQKKTLMFDSGNTASNIHVCNMKM